MDHPTFGAAIISRVLEAYGYRVAILAQPDWKRDDDFMRFGKPELGFLVTAGNIDSMVAHYTAARRRRSTDAYSPGNRAGKRPDRAIIEMCIRDRYRPMLFFLPLAIPDVLPTFRPMRACLVEVIESAVGG